jgi:hypothetical protein
MREPTGYATPAGIGRRDAVRRLAAIALGLAASGCSRGALLRAIYPESARRARSATDAALAAFALTIVPELESPDRIVALMDDPALPFADIPPVLATDLDARAARLVGPGGFARLDPAQRAAVVAHGLAEGGVAGRIYHGAVLFVQAAVYGGMGSADGSCAITGFEGPFRFRGYAEQTYPDPETFLAPAATADGNPW